MVDTHIRMTALVSGVRNGQPWPGRGEVMVVPADEAQCLINLGLAEIAQFEAGAQQTAVAASMKETADEASSTVETATPRRSRKRG